MICPRCAGTLEPTRLSDFSILHTAHGCDRCRGLWVGPEQMHEIAMTEDQRWIEFRSVPDADAQQAPLNCPACPDGVVMRKVVSTRDAAVVTDVCPRCQHVWLDPGEREAIEQDDLLELFSDLLRELFGTGAAAVENS